MESSKKKISQDIYVAVLLLIASVALLVNAGTKMSADAAQFPILILILFIALTVLLFVKGINDTKKRDVADGQIRWAEVKMPLRMFLIITLYVVAVDVVGLILPSILFPMVAMRINYIRNRIVLIAVPTGLVAFLYVLFTFILKTRLP